MVTSILTLRPASRWDTDAITTTTWNEFLAVWPSVPYHQSGRGMAVLHSVATKWAAYIRMVLRPSPESLAEVKLLAP